MKIRVPPANLSLLSFLLILLTLARAWGQDMEPRLYSNAPAEMNFFIASYSYSSGGLSTNPDDVLQNAELTVHSPTFAYSRILDVWGKSGKFDVILPGAQLSGSTDVSGMQATRNISGLADPAFRLAVNLIGAPALTLQEFQSYQQDLIIGVSMFVSVPFGQYDTTRLVNLGTNRWTFRPEIGVSKAIGSLTLELAQNVNFFTTNRNFFGGNQLDQDPVYSTRANLVYNFGGGVTAVLQAVYFAGGRTTLNGLRQDDFIQTSRVGGTLSFDVDHYNSVKLFASRGLTIRTGTDFTTIGAAWQHRWGAGL